MSFKLPIQFKSPAWAKKGLRLGRALSPWFTLIVVLFLVMAGSFLRTFEVYELQTYDWRFQSRPLSPVSKDIVFIEIWDDALEQIGSFPFDRKYYAILVDALRKHGARMIGFDVLFTEPSQSDDVFIESDLLPHITLEKGNIVETGTHQELLENQGAYSKLFTL